MPAQPFWVELLISWHYPIAFVLALLFPLWRAFMRHRSNKFDSKLTVPVAIHQAATGYVMPSFSLMLGASAHPALISHVGAHELALAGIIGLIISAREIFVHE